jgi:DNA-binding HxlR family transcriptional regulator
MDSRCFRKSILSAIASHDGQLSWYQLDRMVISQCPGLNKMLMPELAKLEQEELISSNPNINFPSHPLYHMTDKGNDVLRIEQLIDLLEPALAEIVKVEITAGNQVIQADRRWPCPGKINIHFRRRFMVVHPVNGITVLYHEDKDPHGPFAEYVCLSSGNSLVCSLFPFR